jgi:hypothetical protein
MKTCTPIYSICALNWSAPFHASRVLLVLQVVLKLVFPLIVSIFPYSLAEIRKSFPGPSFHLLTTEVNVKKKLISFCLHLNFCAIFTIITLSLLMLTEICLLQQCDNLTYHRFKFQA